jgi:DNA-directed RNA polymerase specialized sigma24 family protein
MRYKEQQFGGKQRVFPKPHLELSGDSNIGDFLDNVPEKDNSRLTEEQLEIIEIMRAGFKTLSEMQQRVVMLMVDQNMSERKAAKTLGLHYSTVLNHLQRARKKLQKYVMQNADPSIIGTVVRKENRPGEDTSSIDNIDEND